MEWLQTETSRVHFLLQKVVMQNILNAKGCYVKDSINAETILEKVPLT